MHYHVTHEQSRYRVPGPGVAPPGSDDEEDAKLDSPFGPCMRYNYHDHVNSVALDVDSIDQPKGLGGKGVTARLRSEAMGGPE